VPKQPLAEVFGYPIDNQTPEAEAKRILQVFLFATRALIDAER
jgi:hypothetical protein